MMKRYLSVSRSWIHETILCRINVGLQNLRDIEPSDYRTFGLSNLRTIEPSDYRPVPLLVWFLFLLTMLVFSLSRVILFICIKYHFIINLRFPFPECVGYPLKAE